ncbi:MAG: hypothetical protein ACREBW_00365 [Candidatus Micrarchaeaceae archaeon]
MKALEKVSSFVPASNLNRDVAPLYIIGQPHRTLQVFEAPLPSRTGPVKPQWAQRTGAGVPINRTKVYDLGSINHKRVSARTAVRNEVQTITRSKPMEKHEEVFKAIQCLRNAGILRFVRSGEEMKAELLDVHTIEGFDGTGGPILICANQESTLIGTGGQMRRFLRLESDDARALAHEILAGDIEQALVGEGAAG